MQRMQGRQRMQRRNFEPMKLFKLFKAVFGRCFSGRDSRTPSATRLAESGRANREGAMRMNFLSSHRLHRFIRFFVL